MRDKWIGEEVNTSGTYVPTVCEELSIRRGGTLNAKKLYRFTSRYDVEYNITDEEVINILEMLLEKADESLSDLDSYLYSLVIEKFGALEFIKTVDRKSLEESKKSYNKGKLFMQKEMRNLLGIS